MGKLRLGARNVIAETTLSINDPVPEFGGLYIGDTNLHDPAADTTGAGVRGWAQVQVITAATFATGTVCNISGLVGVAIPAGTLLRGIFSEIKLSGGSIIAYYATEQP